MTTHRVLNLLGVAALVALAGCGLFKPDTAEAPDQNLSPIPPLYGSPDQTLATIAQAIEYKAASNGPQVYARALADSLTGSDACEFRAFFDPAVYNNVQSPIVPPDGWDRPHEVPSFYQSFARVRPEPYVMRWQSYAEVPDVVSGNTAQVRRHYLVQAVPASHDSVTIAIGIVDLDMVNSSGAWKICRWQDHVDPAVGANPSDERWSMGQRRLLDP